VLGRLGIACLVGLIGAEQLKIAEPKKGEVVKKVKKAKKVKKTRKARKIKKKKKKRR